jgi:hypothetical protein
MKSSATDSNVVVCFLTAASRSAASTAIGSIPPPYHRTPFAGSLAGVCEAHIAAATDLAPACTRTPRVSGAKDECPVARIGHADPEPWNLSIHDLIAFALRSGLQTAYQRRREVFAVLSLGHSLGPHKSAMGNGPSKCHAKERWN